MKIRLIDWLALGVVVSGTLLSIYVGKQLYWAHDDEGIRVSYVSKDFLMLDGLFRSDSLDLLKYADRLYNVPVGIILNSVGGNVRSAMSIASYFRQTGRMVVVIDTCASACVLALAGGTIRLVADGAVIEVHRPYVAIANSKVPVGDENIKIIEEFLTAFNVDPKIAALMADTPPDRNRRLTPKEIEAMKLAVMVRRETTK